MTEDHEADCMCWACAVEDLQRFIASMSEKIDDDQVADFKPQALEVNLAIVALAEIANRYLVQPDQILGSLVMNMGTIAAQEAGVDFNDMLKLATDEPGGSC